MIIYNKYFHYISPQYCFTGKLSYVNIKMYKYIKIQLGYMEFRDIIYIIIAIIVAVIILKIIWFLLPIIIILVIAFIIYLYLKGRDRYG
jgi:hypothetical protein